MKYAQIERRLAKLEKADENRLDKVWKQAQAVFLTDQERGRVRVHEASSAIGIPATAGELAWYNELKTHAVNEHLYEGRHSGGFVSGMRGGEARKALEASARWAYLNPETEPVERWTGSSRCLVSNEKDGGSASRCAEGVAYAHSCGELVMGIIVVIIVAAFVTVVTSMNAP